MAYDEERQFFEREAQRANPVPEEPPEVGTLRKMLEYYALHHLSLEDMAALRYALRQAGENERLRAAALACAIPYEGLLLDGGSRKWIAPSLWQAIEDAVQALRAALLRPAATEGE